MQDRLATLRAVCVPLFFYIAITLGVPFVRGGYRRAGFGEHAGFVILICVAVVGVFVLVSGARRNETS